LIASGHPLIAMPLRLLNQLWFAIISHYQLIVLFHLAIA